MKKKSKKDQLLVPPKKLAFVTGVFVGIFMLVALFIFLSGGINLRTTLAPQSETITVTGTVPNNYPSELNPVVTANAQLSGNILTVNFDQSQLRKDTGYTSEGSVYGYFVKDLIISVNGDQKEVQTTTVNSDSNLEAQRNGTIKASYQITDIDTSGPLTIDVSVKFYFWKKIKAGSVSQAKGCSMECSDSSECVTGLTCVDVNNLGTKRCAVDCSANYNAWPPYLDHNPGCTCNTDSGS